VENDSHDRAVNLTERDAKNEDRPTFSTMPQSKSQTSPRLGVILVLLDYGGKLIACGCDEIVIEWT